MGQTFSIYLEEEEMQALKVLAAAEMRQYKSQAIFIIRKYLENPESFKNKRTAEKEQNFNDIEQSHEPPHFPTRLLKAGEIAAILQISNTQAYRLMQTGVLRSVRFGGIVRCDAQDLADFIEQSKSENLISEYLEEFDEQRSNE
jgi:excisionase family DNA binding protein